MMREGAMTTGSGGKSPTGSSQPGPTSRAAADTPQRLVVRSVDSGSDSAMGANDTAVADDERAPMTETSTGPTPAAGVSPFRSEIVGTTLSGRYLVTRKVGQGGMGAVYEATHTLIGKRVAVKVLLEKYAQREAIVARLKQEAQLASSVGNEHIIDITDFGTTEDGRTFVVMEFLEGESLAECLARETRLPEQRILKIVYQAASALAAAHAKGIVHRDIKPENLFLLRRKDQDFVKVVDFGISKSLRASGEEEEQPRLTQTGMVLGTPLYMSPEQARGDDELDARVDIYALGVIMYETASGRVPFIGNNYLSVISQVLNETPKPLRDERPELSEEFEAIVMRAMAKDRSERYESATDMLVDVSALLDDPTRSTERAKITGPRRKVPKKSAVRYVVWLGAVAVLVAAIAVTVKVMMTGPTKAALAATRDAGPAAATPDAGPPALDAAPVPEHKYVEMRLVTDPVGATILQEGVVVTGINGELVTPMTIKVLEQNEKIEFIAQLAGYNESKFKKNPLEYDPRTPIKVTLDKPKAGRPIQHTVPRQGSGSDTGSGRHNPTGGEFGGYPGDGSGTVLKKP
jgi:tRNA A-37 threonylcarbamoyl transferase component Bud32